METLTILSVVEVPAAPWIACGFAVLLATFVLSDLKHVRGTTLVAPLLWVALSAVCLASGALLATKLEGISWSALRFAVATSTFCPLMAVLGAKRPQDRGWQWVVLTLWIVLVWPAAQAVVLPAGVRVELFVAWKLFLWGLILLGLFNYLPTRYWRSAILVALGQVLLLREHLWLPSEGSDSVSQLVAYLSLLSATGLVSSSGAPSAGTPDAPLSALSLQWISFRDRYGSFWALRLLGRVNQAAQQRKWPLRLDWSGLVTTGEHEPNEQQLEELSQTMDSVLRRFNAEDTSSK